MRLTFGNRVLFDSPLICLVLLISFSGEPASLFSLVYRAIKGSMSSNGPEMTQNSNGLYETYPTPIGRPPAKRSGRIQFAHRDSLDEHDRRPVIIPDGNDLEIASGRQRTRGTNERSALLRRDDQGGVKLDAKSILVGVTSTLVVLGILVLATFVRTGGAFFFGFSLFSYRSHNLWEFCCCMLTFYILSSWSLRISLVSNSYTTTSLDFLCR